MTYKEFMFQSLGELLIPGEKLQHPIYGILNQGNEQFYGYFGLTETHLLIALISATGKQVIYTNRIPLEINYVRISKTTIFRQRIINISLQGGGSLRITANPRVMMIDCQNDNLAQFSDFLKGKALNTTTPSLKHIHGTKIRRMYLNSFIYSMLSFIPALYALLIVLQLKRDEFDPGMLGKDLFMVIGMVVVLLSPFILLSLSSKHYFGKIVCVITEKGLYLENEFIPWINIRKITYEPKFLLGSRRLEHTYASILINSPQSGEYITNLLHFPRYGLKKIKQHHPEVEVKFSNRAKKEVLLMVLTPILLVIILSLLI